MKTLVIVLKAMGIALLCLSIIPIIIFITFTVPDTEDPVLHRQELNKQKLVHSQAFQRLHHLVYLLDNTKDIVVLPEKDYIVIDKLAINVTKRTYGHDPNHGIYQSTEGSRQHTFSSLNALLASHHLDSTTVDLMVEAMRATHVMHIEIKPKVISYRFHDFAFGYTEEGILYDEDGTVATSDTARYRQFKLITPRFYRYSR